MSTTNRSRDSWNRHIHSFRDQFIDNDVVDNQQEYLRTAKKPERTDVKPWIRRMKTINNYIPYMGINVSRFTEEQLVRYCITPNIPLTWRKDFKLGRSHMLQSTNKAAHRLKIVQEHEKIQEAKNGNKSKKSNKNKRFPNKKKGFKGNK